MLVLLRALAGFLDLVLASVAVLEVREHDSFVGWGVGGMIMITFLEVACNATHVVWAGTMSTSGHGGTTAFIVAGKQSQKS